MAFDLTYRERRLKLATVDLQLVEKRCHVNSSNEKELGVKSPLD